MCPLTFSVLYITSESKLLSVTWIQKKTFFKLNTKNFNLKGSKKVWNFDGGIPLLCRLVVANLEVLPFSIAILGECFINTGEPIAWPTFSKMKHQKCSILVTRYICQYWGVKCFPDCGLFQFVESRRNTCRACDIEARFPCIDFCSIYSFFDPEYTVPMGCLVQNVFIKSYFVLFSLMKRLRLFGS